MPIVTFPRLLLQLVFFALLALGAYLVWSWWRGYDLVRADGAVLHAHAAAWRLWTGLGLLVFSLGGGRPLILLFIPAGREPEHNRTQARIVQGPDGASLHVETSGREEGPTIVLTHGWGLNSTAWGETRRALNARFRVVTWDLPGLGRSKGPQDGAYSLDRFARNLGAVVQAQGEGPVLLVGHSIGGMTTQTFFRAAPEAVRRRVVGVVLVNTTYEDPIRTMWLRAVCGAL